MKANHLKERYSIYRVAVLLMGLCLVAVLSAGCESREQPLKEREMTLSLSSIAFQQ